jgi:hypothetical protein
MAKNLRGEQNLIQLLHDQGLVMPFAPVAPPREKTLRKPSTIPQLKILQLRATTQHCLKLSIQQSATLD